MTDPLEAAMSGAWSSRAGWLDVGRRGGARVLVSRPDARRWLLVYDAANGLRTVLRCEVVLGQVYAHGFFFGRRVAARDLLAPAQRCH